MRQRQAQYVRSHRAVRQLGIWAGATSYGASARPGSHVAGAPRYDERWQATNAEARAHPEVGLLPAVSGVRAMLEAGKAARDQCTICTHMPGELRLS